MSKRIGFSFVTALLLLLLIAAVLNYLFITHAYNTSVTGPSAQQPPLTKAEVETAAKSGTAAKPSISHAILAQGYGDVVLGTGKQGYTLSIGAYGDSIKLGIPYIPADSVEADIRKLGASEPKATLSFTKYPNGNFSAPVEGLSAGSWEVRIRIHRGLQTLEFAEKFDLK